MPWKGKGSVKKKTPFSFCSCAMSFCWVKGRISTAFMGVALLQNWKIFWSFNSLNLMGQKCHTCHFEYISYMGNIWDKTAGGILAGTMCRLRHPNPGTHFWVPATISPKSMFLCIKAYWMNRFCCIHGLGGFSPVQNLNINLYSFHVEYVYVIRYQIGVLAAGYMPCSQYCILYQKQ